MATPQILDRCPKCDSPMDSGVIATEQKGGNFLLGGMKCSRLLWSDSFKMRFIGGPKGEDVSTCNTHSKYMAIPAQRCSACRLIVFGY